MTCHLFKSVQFDFEEGNFRSDLKIELLLSFAFATQAPPCTLDIKCTTKEEFTKLKQFWVCSELT